MEANKVLDSPIIQNEWLVAYIFGSTENGWKMVTTLAVESCVLFRCWKPLRVLWI
jgi:hypothetical protein